VNDASTLICALAPRVHARLIPQRIGRYTDYDLMRCAPGFELSLRTALDDAHRLLRTALGQLECELAGTLGGAVPEPQLRAREPGRHDLGELAGADQQCRSAVALLAQQPSHLRTIGGTAQSHQILRANLLGIVEQLLHAR